jgi:hypothetical protein
VELLTMSLPEGFLFSQSNLQDYVDCQRRFQLRHIIHQAWPAVEAEPYLENERKIDRGAQFHQYVRQHLIGVSDDQIIKYVEGDEIMETWWNNYLHSVKEGVLKSLYETQSVHYEEVSLSVPIKEFRLVAKYDVLLIQPDDHWIILDWKTSQNHPKRRLLEERLQTHVYPFVLAGAGAKLTGKEHLDPGQIEMIYWFTNQPEQPEHFVYDTSRYREDERTLNSLVATVSQKTDPIFPLTPDVKRCLYCTYRSLCNRGVQAGDLQHVEEWTEAETPEAVRIDFDQIGEIEL